MYNFMLIKWNRKRTTTLSLFFYLQRAMNNQQDDTKMIRKIGKFTNPSKLQKLFLNRQNRQQIRM